MSDRLNDLRRQRALVAEHLAWLDREIAETSGLSTVAPLAAPSPTPPAPPAHPEPATRVEALVTAAELSPEAAADAEAILEQYRVQPDSLQTDVKKGCFLYFFAALAFVALAVVGLYFFFQRGK